DSVCVSGRGPTGKRGFRGLDRLLRVGAATLLEEAEDELRVCGARVLEGRRGPDVLATNDHRMFLPELGPDLVDGGLIRGVEFLRLVHLDRVLPRPLVPEVHRSHALGSTDAGSENKVSPHPTNLNRSTRFGFEVYPDSPRPFRV